MIRVLQCVNIMDRAGLETMLMNYYRNIDRNEIQFDFLTHRPEKGTYDDEIERLGGKVYYAPRLYPQNYPAYFKWMAEFFKKHPEYKIVHSHIDTMSYFPLLAAKKSGIPYRIAQSHNSRIGKDFKWPIKFFALKRLPYVANIYFACGQKAGEFIFKDRKFTVINNAIDTNKFKYDKDKRESKRNGLHIAKDTFAVGHVGRFNYVKNQLFLIDIFNQILISKPNSKLILCGKGEDLDKIRDKIKNLEIEDKVIILIDRDDVNELYQAMDVFVMPSIFEGLPVVGVEAQTNGLPTMFSDTISKEVLLTSNARLCSLKEDAKSWAEVILNTNVERNRYAVEEITRAGFDIKNEAKKLTNAYMHIEDMEWN